MMIKLGSCFSGIGGFELGLERAIPNIKTIWQIEKNPFCLKVLEKHWPNVKRYRDINLVNYSALEKPDILCSGFPCQDISIAGKKIGLKGEKSGLWFSLFELIRALLPPVVLLENVPIIVKNGLPEIAGCFSSIGYDLQWTIISAKEMGAPHIRKRWFAVATNADSILWDSKQIKGKSALYASRVGKIKKATNANKTEEHFETKRTNKKNYWREFPTTSGICRRNDGIPDRLDRIKALGNAIVPQCSEYLGRLIIESGTLDILMNKSESQQKESHEH